MLRKWLIVFISTFISSLVLLWTGTLVAGAAEAPALKQTGMGGGVTIFTDRTLFTTQNPGLPFEDWDGSCPSAIGLPTPLNSTSDNNCYNPGDILPGITARSNIPTCAGNFCLLYHPEGYTNTLNSWVGAFAWQQPHLLVFSPTVSAVGLDLASFYLPSAMNIQFYDGEDNLVAQQHLDSVGPAGTFLGLTYPGGISRVEIASVNNSSSHGYEGTYGVLFGEMVLEPDIEASPLTFDELHNMPPQVTTDTLTIENVGTDDLEWSLTELDSVAMGGDGCPGAVDIPWLTLTPTIGNAAPGESDTVTLTYDSAGLAPGIYSGNVCIGSNDRDEATLLTRLTLTVAPPPTAIELREFNSTSGDIEWGVALALWGIVAAGAVYLVQRKK
jgi:hypothetical protein